MDSIAQRIENHIKTFDRGHIFFADDLVGIGSSDAIRQTLLRLTKAGLIIRAAQGIYCYPKISSKQGGILYPTYEQIAKAIAAHSRARIVPTGDYAMNKLGLSTQVPVNIVYLTDGPTRMVKISGDSGIMFKNTAPKNLSFKNRLAMLVTSALKSIKKENVTEAQIKQIHDLLRKEGKEAVLEDLPLMPAWIRNIVIQAYA